MIKFFKKPNKLYFLCLFQYVWAMIFISGHRKKVKKNIKICVLDDAVDIQAER